MNQGYEDSRFETTVNKNFHCPICMNVLKDPVQCQTNQHYFCTPCITKHINENSQTCPMCMDPLTSETLGQPARIVVDYLSSLKISCDYAHRGCREMMELGLLHSHVADCGYSPVICSNEKCMIFVNKRDQEHHETEDCEFRIIQCHDCSDEMSHKRYMKHGCLLNKEVEKIKLDLLEVKDQLGKMRSAQEEILKEIRDMMAELQVTKNTEQTVKYPVRTDTRGDIVVIGGFNNANKSQLNSVETFSWAQRAWTPLSPMQQGRAAATSFCYENQIIVAGGWTNNGITNSMERMLLDQDTKWIDFSGKLPYKCMGHKSVVYNDRLLLAGGNKTSKTTNAFHEVLLKSPHTSTFRSRLPSAICFHGLECINDKILIFGGTTTRLSQDSVDNVLMYDLTNNECKQLEPLPLAMCGIATVKWEDNVIIIGGADRQAKALNTVFMYNYKKKECKALPPMKYRRAESAAVISGNAVVVMGGYNELGCLNSVECFTFDRNFWEELPPMIECRGKLTAVVKPVKVI